MKDCKKILIITYYWPPFGGTGVYRILKFVKYLRKFGYEPLILTCTKADSPIYDEKLFDEIPEGIKTTRTEILEPTGFFRKKIAPRGEGKVTTTIFQKEQTSPKMQLAKWVRLNFFVPDAKIGWKKYAVQAGKEIIEQEQPVLIFSTSPPPTAQLIAKELAQWSGLPWVADFRDPWTRIFYLDKVNQWSSAKRKNERLEKEVLETCQLATVVNNGFFPHLGFEEKEFVIPNGFDPAEFEGIIKMQNRQFTIRYFGGYKVNQFAEPLFKALTQLCQNEEVRKKIMIEFYGFVDPAVHREIKKCAPNVEIAFHDYIDRQKMVELMAATDLGLLFIGRGSINATGFSTKIFEYLAAGLHVLGFGPVEGAAGKLLKGTGSGKVFDYEDEEGVLEYLLGNYEIWAAKGRLPEGKASEIEKYSFVNLTGKLAAQFDEVLKKSR